MWKRSIQSVAHGSFEHLLSKSTFGLHGFDKICLVLEVSRTGRQLAVAFRLENKPIMFYFRLLSHLSEN